MTHTGVGHDEASEIPTPTAGIDLRSNMMISDNETPQPVTHPMLRSSLMEGDEVAISKMTPIMPAHKLVYSSGVGNLGTRHMLP